MKINDIGVIKNNLDEMNIEEIIRSTVKTFGTSAHTIVSKKHIGKKLIIIILKEEIK